jgi:hypothetical protein
MDLTIKNLRVLAGGAFSCSLYVQGKRAAVVVDHGRGGQLRYDWTPSGGGPNRPGDVGQEAIKHAVRVLDAEEPGYKDEPWADEALDEIVTDAVIRHLAR